MILTSADLSRVRELAVQVRQRKEQNYDLITWDQAKHEVARAASKSTDDYYKTLALFQYFIDESRALSSLDVFLEKAGEIAEDLRDRDQFYAIDEAERFRIQRLVELFLERVGPPASSREAFDYYQVLIDRIFISTTLVELLGSMECLASVLGQWYPNAFQEVHLIAGLRHEILAFAELAESPVTLAIASVSAERDFSPLKQILHRFVRIGVFEVDKIGRQSFYKCLTWTINTSLLRKEWTWLWCRPGERLSLKLYK